jgi:signal transduction histidine kinase
VGQRLDVLVPERVRVVHEAHRAQYFDRPHPRPLGTGLTLTGLRKDGREFPIEIALVHFHDEQGALAMALVTDLSERVDLERQARHRDQLTALGSLAVSIAHELNNPVAIVLSRIDLMIMELEEQDGIPHPIADQLRTDLHALHRQAQRLARIAQSVLSFGQEHQPVRQPTDLSVLVRDTVYLARTRLSPDLAVSTSFDPRVPPILGDESALRLALMSLLLGARHTIPAGGVIRFETMLIRAPNRPETVRLAMSHSGQEPPELTSVGSVANRPGFDLSLGLAIIRDHGGTIEVRSEPGVGTTFTLEFPAHEGAGPR